MYDDLPESGGNGQLVLADGRKVDVSNGRLIRESAMTKIESNVSLMREQSLKRKRLDELPLPPANMHIVGVVCVYTMFGLSDADICEAIGLDGERLKRIKDLPAYIDFYEEVVSQIFESDAGSVRDLIAQHQMDAAATMAGLLNSDSEAMQFQASKDLMDRGGHRPVDRVMHEHSFENVMQVEFIDRAKEDEVPTIDLKSEMVNDT